jgi:hypothetical protein
MLNRFKQVEFLEFLPGVNLNINMIAIRPFRRLKKLDISRCIFDGASNVLKLVNKCEDIESLKMSQHLCDLALLRTLYKNGQVASSYFKSLKLKGYFRNKIKSCIDSDAMSLFLRECPCLEKLQITKASAKLFKNLKFQNIPLNNLKTLDIKELYFSSLQDWAIFVRYSQNNFRLLKSLKISVIIFQCRPPNTEEFETQFSEIIASKPHLESLTLGEYTTDALLIRIRRTIIQNQSSQMKNLKIKSKFVTDESMEEFLQDINITNSLDIVKTPKISGYCFESLAHPPVKIRVSFDDYKLGCLRDTLISLDFKDTLIYRTKL